nr:MAG TPA: hypothetical protein [Caudoviricetes sp.]
MFDDKSGKSEKKTPYFGHPTAIIKMLRRSKL